MTSRGYRGKAPSRSRLTAFQILRSIRKGAADPATALHTEELDRFSQEDQRLTTELVYGVLRLRGRLDFELERYTRRPLHRSHPDVVEALRLGLYQIRYLDRVPARAAVDESVRLVRTSRSAGEAKFVNGLLRAILRAGPPTLPDRDSDPVGYLTNALSHPGWLVRRYLDRLGLERASERCQIQNEPPVVYLRVTKRQELASALERLAGEGVEATTVAWLPRALRVVKGSVVQTQMYRRGEVMIQDGGSQLVPMLVDVSPGDEVLDVSAAPGGKTSALAESTRAAVFAFDLRFARARLLAETTLRVGSTNVHVGVADGRALPLDRQFPRILLDVPCSSLGTLRRNPDIKWRLDESDLARFASVQSDLLARAAQHLAPGGRLVYATCSTEPEENEVVVRTFLDSSAGSRFSLVDPRPSLPTSTRRFVEDDDCFRTYPERDETDGYFAAVLTK